MTKPGKFYMEAVFKDEDVLHVAPAESRIDVLTATTSVSTFELTRVGMHAMKAVIQRQLADELAREIVKRAKVEERDAPNADVVHYRMTLWVMQDK